MRQGALPGSQQRHGLAAAENRRPEQADGTEPLRVTAGNQTARTYSPRVRNLAFYAQSTFQEQILKPTVVAVAVVVIAAAAAVVSAAAAVVSAAAVVVVV